MCVFPHWLTVYDVYREGVCLFSYWLYDHLWILVCLFLLPKQPMWDAINFYAFPSQGMHCEMATKWTD